jgi:hypothetical protein
MQIQQHVKDVMGILASHEVYQIVALSDALQVYE